MKISTHHALLVITAIIVALYAKTLFFEYTYLDDNRLIAENFWFISSLSSVPKAFTSDVFLDTSPAYYRPFVTLSFIPDAITAGDPQNLLPFHLTNIFLHWYTSLLLFLLIQKLGYSKQLSLFLTILFAVHPAIVQAVAWIPGRNDSLLAVWVLACILSWLQFVSSKRNKIPWLILHMATFLGALFSKETAIVLPVIIVGMTMAYQQPRFSFTTWWLIGMGWLGVLLSWFLLRATVITSTETTSLSSVPTAIMHNWPALAVYLEKTVVPINQSVLSIVAGSQPVVGLVIGTLATLYLSVMAYHKKPVLKQLFSFLWFFAFLAPAVFFHNPTSLWGQDLQLEHRLYLPLMGILLLLAEILSLHVPKKREVVQWVVLASIALIFFAKSFAYSEYFRDRFSFWNQAARTSPLSPLAHRNLGAMHQLTNNKEQAQISYETALALNPEEIMVHNNLGLLAKDAGDLAKAEALFRKEIAINPSFSLAYGNLAELLFNQEKVEEARALWLKKAQLEPNNAEPLLRYAQTFKTLDPERYQKLLQELQASASGTLRLE